MKYSRSAPFALAVALALPSAALAQAPALEASVVAPAVAAPATPIQQVGLHPLSLTVGKLSLDYERRLAPNWSVLVSPQVGISRLVGIKALAALTRGVGIELGARWYPSQGGLRGFFLQPSASYYAHMPDKYLGTSHRFAAGGKVGYQWMVANRVALHLSGGADIVGTSASERLKERLRYEFDEEILKMGLSGVIPDASFGIGFGF